MANPSADDGVSRLISELSGWTARARAQEAAGSRAKEAWLRRQAAEDTTWASVLADLVERADPVAIETTVGRVHNGHLAAVGFDFVLLTPPGRPSATLATLLAMEALSALRPHRSLQGRLPGGGEGGGPLPSSVSQDQGIAASKVKLVDVLAELAVERTRVSLVTSAGHTHLGELRWVGLDVAGIRSDGDEPGDVHVRLAGVREVSVLRTH